MMKSKGEMEHSPKRKKKKTVKFMDLSNENDKELSKVTKKKRENLMRKGRRKLEENGKNIDIRKKKRKKLKHYSRKSKASKVLEKKSKI